MILKYYHLILNYQFPKLEMIVIVFRKMLVHYFLQSSASKAGIIILLRRFKSYFEF